MYAQLALAAPDQLPALRRRAPERPVASRRDEPPSPAADPLRLLAGGLSDPAGASWLAASAPALQRSIGNRALASIVEGLGRAPLAASANRTATPAVQRCGDVDPATCSCHDGEDSAGGEGSGPVMVARTVVQRELAPAQAESIARKLEDAMSGWGTDEDAIYGALSGRSAGDMREIKAAYSRLFGEDLDAELRDELTDEELARVSQMASPVADETTLPAADAEALKVDRARVIADRLREAMEGLGTDEDAIFAALSGRTHDEIAEIKRQYLELTDRYLERDLQDELSGEDLRRAINLIDVVGEFETTGFSECTPDIRAKVRQFVPIAKSQVQKAIVSLQPGWSRLDATVEASFRRYFDPGNSGQLDARFVRLVLEKFHMIADYMNEGLDFDCDLASGSICGDGHKWCGEGDGNGRLYWTCFGALHVCANAGWLRASDERRWSDIIHESTHNALHTTDRAYCNSTDWPSLTPYGTGAMSVLDEIPVIGKIFSLAGGGGDTLNNPDSYSHFAQDR